MAQMGPKIVTMMKLVATVIQTEGQDADVAIVEMNCPKTTVRKAGAMCLEKAAYMGTKMAISMAFY